MMKIYTIADIENYKLISNYVLPNIIIEKIKNLHNTITIVEETSSSSSSSSITNINIRGEHPHHNAQIKFRGGGDRGGNNSNKLSSKTNTDRNGWTKVNGSGGVSGNDRDRDHDRLDNMFVRSNSKSGGSDDNSNEWNKMKLSPKPSIMKPNQTVSEEHIHTIRVLFNKISNKNYESQKDLILNELDKYFVDSQSQSQLSEDIDVIDPNVIQCPHKKITDVLFSIFKTNKSFYEIYSNLYKDFIEKNEKFKVYLYELIIGFNDSIDHIYYIDPNTDYDKYCIYIKENDTRKATAMFIIGLYKNEVLESSEIFQILTKFLEKIMQYIYEDHRTNEVEEITENVFLIFTNIKCDDFQNSQYIDARVCIENITKLKIKECKSLTSRVIFKYLDIIQQKQKTCSLK